MAYYGGYSGLRNGDFERSTRCYYRDNAPQCDFCSRIKVTKNADGNDVCEHHNKPICSQNDCKHRVTRKKDGDLCRRCAEGLL